VVLGAFLAWATVTAGLISVSRAGTDGDGVITLVLGVVLAATAVGLVMQNGARRVLASVATVVSVIIFAVAVYDIVDVQWLVNEAEASGLVDASVGPGLWLTAVGAGAATVGGVMAFID